MAIWYEWGYPSLLWLFCLCLREHYYCWLFHWLFLPNTGEATIFAVAMVGAVIGFFWYNTYPAQVFMGDTGSLDALGSDCRFGYYPKKGSTSLFCGIFLNWKSSAVIQWLSNWKKNMIRNMLKIIDYSKLSPLYHHYQIIIITKVRL